MQGFGDGRGSMRIAVFIHSLSAGGAQRRTVTLVNAFAERGHEVELVVVEADGVLSDTLSPQVTLVKLPGTSPANGAAHRQRRGRQVMRAIPSLARYLRDRRPDVFLSAANHANVAALLARRRSGASVPTVIRVSNLLPQLGWGGPRPPRPLRWLAIRLLFPTAASVVAVGYGVAEDLAKRAGIAEARIATIHNPITTPDVAVLARTDAPHPWLQETDPPVILAAGRLVAQKDFPTLIRAFKRLRGARSARLIILGSGPKRDDLLAHIDRLGLTDDVHLAGYVDNPLVWMARASLFVLSSAWEGLPGVLIEAMACGCPVVSTDCRSGPREILGHGAYGPLVPVGNDRTLADAMAYALGAPPDREALRRRAAAFAHDTAIDRYLQVLRTAADARSQARTDVVRGAGP